MEGYCTFPAAGFYLWWWFNEKERERVFLIFFKYKNR